MARGFGTTRGSANTDRVVSTYTTSNATRSFFIRSYRQGNSTSGTGYGALFMKSSGTQWYEGLYYQDSQSVYRFSCQFSGSVPVWTFTAPSATTWASVGITYDSSNINNDPVVYVDGASVTVTETVAPVGSLYTTGSIAWAVGSRQDSGRVWNGDLQDFAMWNEILTADENAALAAGVSPLLIRPHALVEFITLDDDVRSWVRPAVTVTGTAVQADPVGRLPHYSDEYNFSTGAAGGTTKTVTLTLVTSPTDGTARANLTGLKWAFFDQITPDLFSAPTDKGSTETTDGSGVLSILVPNSTKTNGQIGYLVVTDSDGTTGQSPAAKVFAGPVSVTVV